jgi:hypothetical protein
MEDRDEFAPGDLSQPLSFHPSNSPTGPEAVVALATRVAVLAERLETVRQGGVGRDRKLETLSNEVRTLTDAVRALTEQQAKLTHAQIGQLSAEDVTVVRTILKGYERTMWFRGRAKVIFFSIGATVATIYALRDFLKWVLSSIPGLGK